ncbi:MAG: 2-oxoacid:acceptor oxidoreductase subunit alpha [Anaerolineae bacterium]|nr:2-oxoacid:acceptor oxidoreductase subunit alpha [Anaerolineae bacterium]
MQRATLNDLTIRIGGEAGHGVESSGAGFCQALTRVGLYVFGLPDYYSRIRGGHNFYSIRVSDAPLYAHTDDIHLLLALTEETITRHQDALAPGGAVLYDTRLKVTADMMSRDDVLYVGLPMSEIAKDRAGTELARNTLALGFAAGISGLDLDGIASVIRDNFGRKGQAVIDGNLDVARWGQAEGARHAAEFPFRLQAIPDAPPRMAVNGTQAFSLGALAGGCRFASSYPMTPGSPVLHWLAAHSAKYGVAIKHTEDEIAGICMAIGAAHMGARALVPTSGGGFSLMVEALGLAGMTETPVVIYNAQRPGPSTGLPTRNEQGDLLFTIYASQGDFPRCVLAPATVEDCFVAGWRAFNLAERFQTPVIVLSDHYLAVMVRTLDVGAFDWDAVEIDRGALLTPEQLDALDEEYKRFKDTPSGVSPRALPGHPRAVYVSDSDEHDEAGHITEESAVRIRQMDKRMRKMAGMEAEMGDPICYGPAEAEITLVGWGSTYGPLREAVDRLNAASPGRANLVNFTDLWPLPADRARAALVGAHKRIAVEVNATAQFATLLRACTGIEMDGRILKYDGRPLSPEEIVKELEH